MKTAWYRKGMNRKKLVVSCSMNLSSVIKRGYKWCSLNGFMIKFPMTGVFSLKKLSHNQWTAVHWLCDSFFSENTPVIGNLIINPFREHHLYPLLITEDKFIEQDTTSFFLFMPFLYHAVFIKNNYLENPNMIDIHFLLVGLCIGTFCTNLFHKWAHLWKRFVQNVPIHNPTRRKWISIIFGFSR